MAYNQTKLHVNLYVQLTVGFIKSRVKFSFLTTHSLNNLIPRFALLRLAALGLRKIASLGIRLLNSLGQKTKFHSRQNGSHCFLHIQVNKNHFPPQKSGQAVVVVGNMWQTVPKPNYNRRKSKLDCAINSNWDIPLGN